MMEISPIKNIDIEINAPASKSYTNRALIIAALADGKSVLKNPLISDDTKYMKDALASLGVKIDHEKDSFIVHGTGGKLNQPDNDIFVGNAGTAMRFLTGLVSLVDGKTIITGSERMKQRPIQDLLDGLNQLGIKSESTNKCPPVEIHGGTLDGGKVKIPGDKSSQYFSSIMMTTPYAKGDIEIEVIGDLTSKSYVDITIDIMKQFGVEIENNDYKNFKIKNNQTYSAKEYKIEGDASSASYFFGAAAITKGKAKVMNLNPDSAQGDIIFPDVLEKMGCKVEKNDNYIIVEGNELKGVDVDMNFMPDTVQTLGVVALFAKGKTTIRNIANLRIKETDRIGALARELKRLGAEVEETEDSITIIPKDSYSGVKIETYEDHRMAMSFSLAGLNIDGIVITDSACVSKSFPDYWKEFQKIYEK